MRLLNSKSLEMKEFLPDAMIYKYAILSHRWGAEEISFQDVTSKHSDANAKKGYKKLKLCCQQAAKDGFEWVWIDTCCIDKSSSAELSEAINSMYQWYRNAKICYVYLADVTYRPFDFESTLEEFQTSEWFTRGWTLQELIAPSSMHFFAKDWTEIGTKRSLLKNIHTAAGVAKEVLEGEQVPAARSIAERMAWAADRKTSRPEDVAYCLLGIFQVNMPLMYGEGHRAFERLQQEILRQEEDYTILAWPTPTSGRNNFGVLCTNPSAFGADRLSGLAFYDGAEKPETLSISRIRSFHVMPHFGRALPDKALNSIHRFHEVADSISRLQVAPPMITSRGLRATVLVIPRQSKLLAWTFCIYVDNQLSDYGFLLCMELCSSPGDVSYHRTSSKMECYPIDKFLEFKPKDIYLGMREPRRIGGLLRVVSPHRAYIHLSDKSSGSIVVRAFPGDVKPTAKQLNTRPCYEINLSSRWDRSGCTILVVKWEPLSSLLELENAHPFIFVAAFGLNNHWDIWCLLSPLDDSDMNSLQESCRWEAFSNADFGVIPDIAMRRVQSRSMRTDRDRMRISENHLVTLAAQQHGMVNNCWTYSFEIIIEQSTRSDDSPHCCYWTFCPQKAQSKKTRLKWIM